MNLSRFSIKRPVTTLMIFLLVLVLGLVSITRLNIDLLPKMTFPVAAVFTSYEGVGPQEVENMVTKPLEGVLGTVPNVKGITTISSAGQSIAIVQFEWGTNMDFALLDVREKIDLIKSFFPKEIDNPLVFKFDPAMMPIINLAVSGISDLATLKQVAEDEVKPRLERLNGVASVDISGGLVSIIKIEVDPAQLHAYGLTLQSITQILQAENLNLPGGIVRSGNLELMVRTTGQFERLEQIEQLNIPSAHGSMVKLKEVASVTEAFKDRTSYVLLNGEPAVGIAIQKETDANTVNVSRQVLREMAKIKKDLLSGLTFEVVMNQADFIQRSIDNLKSNAVVGGLLAVAILYLFLRNLASTLIIGVAIPISIITTFILLYFAKLNLNMMTLGGLALGVGMLVDNAIVVLENIYRFRDQGSSLEEAAIEGSSEVGMAITASTLTTIVVFLPVVFMGGMTAQLFKELALTVTFSLLASLFVAQTLIPMLCSKYLHVKAEKTVKNARKPRQSKETILCWYKRMLAWSLQHRKTVVFFTLFLFALSIVMIFRVGAEFLPSMDEGIISVQIQMPKGSVLSETELVVRKVEETIAEIPETAMVFTMVGSGGSMNFLSSGGDQSSITLQLVDKKQRRRSADEVAEWIRTRTQGITGAEIKVDTWSMMSMSSSGKPINIKLKGEDFAQLENLSADLVALVKEVEGTREVESSLDEGRPELQVQIDRERASTLGLNAYSIASYLRTAIEGATATRFKVRGKEYDVIVCLQENEKGIPGLMELMIPTAIGAQVPLSEVAEVRVEGPNVINREDQERVVSISAAISGRDLNSITKEINKKIGAYPLPTGYSIKIGGEAEEMVTAFRDLLLALLLAVIFVYMILAAQFESLLQPFIIMLTVPLGFIGVSWALAISQVNLSVIAFIGFIMLAGIVVNNAIVLVDYVNILRGKGYPVLEALMMAGPTRFRPIMMTSLTTILGLLPMAIGWGEGSEQQAPMAIVVIGGLTVSTFLTLILIPVFYLSFESFSQKRKKRRQRNLETSLN